MKILHVSDLHYKESPFFYRAGGVAAVGLNSEPDITPRQIEMAVQHFNKGERGEYRIFCAHHSFLPIPTKKLRPGDVVPRRAKKNILAMEDAS